MEIYMIINRFLLLILMTSIRRVILFKFLMLVNTLVFRINEIWRMHELHVNLLNDYNRHTILSEKYQTINK